MTDDHPRLKTCLACKRKKTRTEFAAKSSVCNECAVVYVDHANPENTRKICFTCNEHKPLSAFRLASGGRLGRWNHCSECEIKKYRNQRDIPADRACAQCGAPIDIAAKKSTKYCDAKCRNKSYDQVAARERAKLAHKARVAAVESKRCSICGETKPFTEFYARHAYCKPCYGEDVRKRYEGEDPEKKRERWRVARAKYPERRRMQGIKDKASSGKLKYNSHVFAWKRFVRSTIHDAHVKAMKAWIRHPESIEWCARRWDAIGKPWMNPHLSKADQYMLHYKTDIEFRLGEINRQTWRKQTLAARDDGTIDFRALLAERKTCPYCLTEITKDNAVADHLDPIKLGGANAQHNLTICCRTCNTRKAGRPYLEWVAMLAPSRQRAALAWYKRKHGRDAGQPSMVFEFA